MIIDAEVCTNAGKAILEEIQGVQNLTVTSYHRVFTSGTSDDRFLQHLNNIKGKSRSKSYHMAFLHGVV